MILIFLLAGAFAAMMKETGGVDSTVNMGLAFVPARMILPGLFSYFLFHFFCDGKHLWETLSAVVPIALGFAQSTDVSIPLTMGVVLGGAMFW